MSGSHSREDEAQAPNHLWRAGSARQRNSSAVVAADPSGPVAPSYPVTALESVPDGLRSTFTHRGYLDAVAKVREYIVAGDIFQANLSQRFQAPLRERPFDLYCRLRRRNPAPFAAYLALDSMTVLSASPERFLRLDPDRWRFQQPGACTEALARRE